MDSTKLVIDTRKFDEALSQLEKSVKEAEKNLQRAKGIILDLFWMMLEDKKTDDKEGGEEEK